MVPRPPRKETEILRQSPDGHSARDRGGNARLHGTRRATHDVSMRAVHPGSAQAADRGAPTLSRQGAKSPFLNRRWGMRKASSNADLPEVGTSSPRRGPDEQ